MDQGPIYFPGGHPNFRTGKLTGALYGSYFNDVLMPQLHEMGTMDPEVLPEWDTEVKNAHLLDLNEKFASIDLLHTDTFEGHIHAWNMGFLRERKPDIVVLNFGEPELCQTRRSAFDVASRVIHIAGQLVDEFKVGHVVMIAAIPLNFGIPCSANKFRKRVFGFNDKLEGLTRPRIGMRYMTGFWKDEDGNRVSPEDYAPQSFTPGPEPANYWYQKYVRGLRAAFTESIPILHGNDYYEAVHQYHVSD